MNKKDALTLKTSTCIAQGCGAMHRLTLCGHVKAEDGLASRMGKDIDILAQFCESHKVLMETGSDKHGYYGPWRKEMGVTIFT